MSGLQGEGEVHGAWVFVGAHGGDDQIVAAGTGAVLHVSEHGIDTFGVQEHQRDGTGDKIVARIERRLVDVVNPGVNVIDLFLLDNRLQHVDGAWIGVDCRYVVAEPAQVQRIAPVGAAHVQRIARLDGLARLYHLAVGRVQAVALV